MFGGFEGQVAGDVALVSGDAFDSSASPIIVDLDSEDIRAIVQNLRKAGKGIWGCQTVLGNDPIHEARVCSRSLNEYGLDGLVIRALAEFELPGKGHQAAKFMEELRRVLPDTPIALSSFKLPSYHQRFPWGQFLAYCDFNMPLLDSSDVDNFRAQLIRCQREFQELTPSRPVIPICPLSGESNEILAAIPLPQEFDHKEIDWLGIGEGITDRLGEFWALIQDHPWQTLFAEEDIVYQYFKALNTKDPDQVIELYHPQSALVTSARTIMDVEPKRAWYANLFTQVLPDVNFLLTGHSGTGNSRNTHWIARTKRSIFDSGNPTNLTGLFSGAIEIFKSVYYTKIVRSAPRVHTAHIVSIDLNDSSIDLMVTPPEGLGATTSDFMAKYGLQLAVNGDEWLSWTNPKGLAVSEGVMYSAPSSEPTAYISASNRVQVGGRPPSVLWDAISGSHTLVRNGAMSTKLRTCSKPEVYCMNLAPRTSLGLTRDNRLILIVAQGPEDSLRKALTLKELAALNLELGVQNAICLDGGGSSTLAVDDYGIPKVVNSPSDGSERAVSNHLGIRAQHLNRDSALRVDDGSDTFGLLDGKIIYHFTSFTVKSVPSALDRT